MLTYIELFFFALDYCFVFMVSNLMHYITPFQSRLNNNSSFVWKKAALSWILKKKSIYFRNSDIKL